MKRRLTEEEKNTILELWNNGYEVDEIAEILGVSLATVYSYLPLQEEIKKRKKQIREKLDLKVEKSIKEKIKRVFSFLEDFSFEELCEFGRIKEFKVLGKEKEFIVFVCNNNIEFVVEKKGCRLEERYDLAYMDKLKLLISELSDLLKEGLTEKEVEILLSPEYSVDLHYVDRKKNHFLLRAWQKGLKGKKVKFIPIINSTRDDVYKIAKELVEIRKKVFRGA